MFSDVRALAMHPLSGGSLKERLEGLSLRHIREELLKRKSLTINEFWKSGLELKRKYLRLLRRNVFCFPFSCIQLERCLPSLLSSPNKIYHYNLGSTRNESKQLSLDAFRKFRSGYRIQFRNGFILVRRGIAAFIPQKLPPHTEKSSPSSQWTRHKTSPTFPPPTRNKIPPQPLGTPQSHDLTHSASHTIRGPGCGERFKKSPF